MKLAMNCSQFLRRRGWRPTRRFTWTKRQWELPINAALALEEAMEIDSGGVPMREELSGRELSRVLSLMRQELARREPQPGERG